MEKIGFQLFRIYGKPVSFWTFLARDLPQSWRVWHQFTATP